MRKLAVLGCKFNIACDDGGNESGGTIFQIERLPTCLDLSATGLVTGYVMIGVG